MRVLVIGSGGREHALVWKIAQSKKVEKIYCAPGNPGIAELAELVPISVNQISELAQFAKKNEIDLTVVGPEWPLTLGIVDEFQRFGLAIFGPNRRAAQLEGSKIFAKKFMQKHKIPTANYALFDNVKEAKLYLRKQPSQQSVIKADGLASGKGVIVCKNLTEAEDAVERMLKMDKFGEAGRKIIIEDCLRGEEVSFIAFADGEHVLAMETTQDHKRLKDNDLGPNTGGMGAYSPASIVTPELFDKIMRDVMEPTIRGMASDGRPFVGFLYAGLMIDEGKPFVLEFNVRCGDPETQPLMMRLKSDIVEIMEMALEGRLDEYKAEWDPRPSMCVVMAAGGYPEVYEKGAVIEGLDRAKEIPDAMVFHAGTARKGETIVTNGGRVLGVTAVGSAIPDAINHAYHAVGQISWSGAYFRRDIGHRAIKHHI